jgi:molecular chaperone GrpE
MNDHEVPPADDLPAAPDVTYVVPEPPIDEALAIQDPTPGAQPAITASTDLQTPFPPSVGAGLESVLGAVQALGTRLDESLAPLRSLGDLGRRLDQLHAVIEREGRAESTREKVVDRLHAELQEYKNDLLLKVLRPVFIDLIQLHDDMGKILDAREAGEPGEAERLLDLLHGFQQGIEDILYRQGVEPFTVAEPAFDPRRQRAVQTVSTDDPQLNKRVAARLRKGFQAGDRIIRPELVSVFSHKP